MKSTHICPFMTASANESSYAVRKQECKTTTFEPAYCRKDCAIAVKQTTLEHGDEAWRCGYVRYMPVTYVKAVEE